MVSYETPTPEEMTAQKNFEILDFAPEVEDEYVQRATESVDRFAAEGGETILFDYDGTVLGNNPSEGRGSYVRRAFVDTYTHCRKKGMRVEVCTLRDVAEVDALEQLGIYFDAVNGRDSMMQYVSEHPSAFQGEAQVLLNKPSEEIAKVAEEAFEAVGKGDTPEDMGVLLQAIGMHQAYDVNHPNPKVLFMSHRLSTGERTFLIDDDESSGGIAEKLGIGVVIPRPKGYEVDTPSATLEAEQTLSRIQPTPEITAHAKQAIAEVGVVSAEHLSRNEIIAVAKHLMKWYKNEFGAMGTGHLKGGILDIPMSEEEEDKIRRLVREEDTSPYRLRVDMWKERDNPSTEEIEEKEKVLDEMEMAAEIEKINLGKRTAGQIFSGEIIGSDRNERVFNGCGDPAILFLSEMKALGVRASAFEVVSKNWIDNVQELSPKDKQREFDQSFHGHALVRIYPSNEKPILVIPIDAAVKTNGEWDKYDAKEEKWVKQKSFGPYYFLYEREEAYFNSPFDENTRKHLRDLVEHPESLQIIY